MMIDNTSQIDQRILNIEDLKSGGMKAFNALNLTSKIGVVASFGMLKKQFVDREIKANRSAVSELQKQLQSSSKLSERIVKNN